MNIRAWINAVKSSPLMKPLKKLYHWLRKKKLHAFSRVKTISLEQFLQTHLGITEKLRDEKYLDLQPTFTIPTGPMEKADVAVLTRLLAHLHPRYIFEFGTNWGYSAAIFALNTPPETQVWTLDICREMFDEEYLKSDIELDLMTLRRAETGWAYKQLADISVKVRQIFKDSMALDWAEEAYPDTFDVILIDACHKYAFVKSDTQKAMQKLSQGGLILWHDYYPDPREGWSDVHQCVNEFAKQYGHTYHLAGTNFAVYVAASSK